MLQNVKHKQWRCGAMEPETISKNDTCIETGKQCPRCKGFNTDKQNNIWICWDCHYEW